MISENTSNEIRTAAPVVLFTYNRLSHTQKTVAALSANTLAALTDLIIYSDAAKNDKESKKIAQVRSYLKEISGFRSVKIIERDANMGLANSIISGVSETLAQYGKVIVLEDDLVTSPYFLEFMNEGLERYADDERVVSIHGYIYPGVLPEAPFFLIDPGTWGWATWKRGWDIFEPDGGKLLRQITHTNTVAAFDFNHTYPYLKMLKDQIEGKNDSWGIRWYASAFLQRKLTLHPHRPLVRNIGNDDSGVHSGTTNIFDTEVFPHRIGAYSFPVEESSEARAAYEKFFRSAKRNFSARVYFKIRSILKKFKKSIKN